MTTIDVIDFPQTGVREGAWKGRSLVDASARYSSAHLRRLAAVVAGSARQLANELADRAEIIERLDREMQGAAGVSIRARAQVRAAPRPKPRKSRAA